MVTINQQKYGSDGSQDDSNHNDNQPWEEENALSLVSTDEEENVAHQEDDASNQWHGSGCHVKQSPLESEFKKGQLSSNMLNYLFCYGECQS